MAELYDGFAHQSLLWLEKPGLCGEWEARKLLDAGALDIDGRLPTNSSSGVFSTNCIGDSAINRPAGRALQVTGKIEGDHKMPEKASKAIAHGRGGMFQHVPGPGL